MKATDDPSFRNLAATVMAQEIVVKFLLGMWLNQLAPPLRQEVADGLVSAMARTDGVRAGGSDDFQAELLADVMVLARSKLDAILQQVLDRD